MWAQGEGGTCVPRTEASEGTSPAQTWISDFQPPEVGGKRFLFRPDRGPWLGPPIGRTHLYCHYDHLHSHVCHCAPRITNVTSFDPHATLRSRCYYHPHSQMREGEFIWFPGS